MEPECALMEHDYVALPCKQEIVEAASNHCEEPIAHGQGTGCTQVGRVEVVKSSAYNYCTLGRNAQGASRVEPSKWREATGAVRVDPDIIELGTILTNPVCLEALLVEFGLSVAPPPPRPRSNGGTDITQVGPGRRCQATEIWGKCSELGFNPQLPSCVGRVTTVTRKWKSGSTSLCYRCSACKKMITQRRGVAPWVKQSSKAQESFFYEVDSAGRPNVKLLKRKILWIVYCIAKGLSGTMTRELGRRTFSIGTTSLGQWRHRVRRAASRSLADRPRLGGRSERVQVGIFKRIVNSTDKEEERLILGLQSESTGEFRLRHIEKDDPDTVAAVISSHVLPETTVVSNGDKAFCRVEMAEDEEGPMLLVHDTGHCKDTATPSNRPQSFLNTQKLRVSWRRVLSSLKQSGRLRGPEEFQIQLDWFWWVSLNGPERCKDPFLRLLETIAKAYNS